jgi:hypothetical protein
MDGTNNENNCSRHHFQLKKIWSFSISWVQKLVVVVVVEEYWYNTILLPNEKQSCGENIKELTKK